MRSLLRSLACFPLAAFAFGEADAHATVTGITVTTAAVRRVASDGTTLYSCPGRGSTSSSCVVYGKFQGIGHRDCLDDTEISFSAQVTGLPDTANHIEIWAGTGDCTQQGATHNSSTGTCWPVAPDPPMATPLLVNIRVADIVSQLGSSQPAQVYSVANANVACNNQAASSTTTTTTDAGTTSSVVGESTVNIFFLLYPNGQATPSLSAAAYPVKVKLVGPAAVSNVTASPGDGVIIVTWSPPTGDPSIIGYNLYAAPGGSSGGEGGTVTVCNDGGQLLDDAGNAILDDAGNPITQDAGCYQVSNPPTTASCGSGGTIDISGISCGTTTSAGDAAATSGGTCTQANGNTNAKDTITGVQNGVAYDVAVAAFDAYGNVGTLSSAVCATPQAINDFWKTYRNDGGQAGGFCALQAVGGPGSVPFGALVMIVAGATIARYRRRRSGRDNDKH